MLTSTRASLLVATALCAAAPLAHADTKAWTAAKKALPGDLQVVVGLDANAVRTSQIYQQLMPLVWAKSADAKAGFDKIKEACGIDFMAIVDSAVVGATDDQKFGAVLAFKGKTQKDFDACLAKATPQGKPTTITKDGAYTRYTGFSDKDVVVKWVAKDTVMFVGPDQDKALLDKMTSGGLSTSKTTATALRGTKLSDAVFFVVNKTQDLPELNAKMVQAYGSVGLKAGTASVVFHMVLDSAKAATEAESKASQQLGALKGNGQLPPAIIAVVKNLVLKAVGAELVVSDSATEADVLSVLKLAGLGQ